MKKIINGKSYNTETAEPILAWSNSCGYSDFRHYDEQLYRTKRDNWFVHGSGGPMSPYAEHRSNGESTGGEAISPLTEREAFEWLCEKGHDELAEELFPEMVEEA